MAIHFEVMDDMKGNILFATDAVGNDVICAPLLNKGTAFTKNERDRFGLNGLLPPRILSIIVFCCNWSIFPGLQLSESPTLINTPYGVIVTMCASRVNPELLIHAFKEGAWGVMINGCPPEECEHGGNYKARRRILLFKNLLKQLNIEPKRVRMGWFSSGESIKLKQAIDDFVDELEKLGPIDESPMISYW